jgi:hypothetical protein
MRKSTTSAAAYEKQLALVIGADQCARLVGVTVQRVKQFCQQGRISAKKIGRDWVISRAAALQFAAIDRPTGQRAPTRKTISKNPRRKRR